MNKPDKIPPEDAQKVLDDVRNGKYNSLYQLDAKVLDELTYWHPQVMIRISEYLSWRV